MKASVPFNLEIKPISSGSSSRELLDGIKTLMTASDLFYAEYKRRTLRASKAIINSSDDPGSIRSALTAVDIGASGFKLDTSSIMSGQAYIEASPYFEPDENLGKYYEFTWGGGEARASVQEFGYPFVNRPWMPYPPNPNSPKQALRGVGYKRVAFIVAARSMATDRLNYGTSVSTGAVTDYAKVSERYLYRSYQKIIDNYLSGKKVPNFMSSRVGKPAKAVPLRAGVSKFTFNAGYNLPLNEFTGSQPSWSSPVNLGRRYDFYTSASLNSSSIEPFGELVDYGNLII